MAVKERRRTGTATQTGPITLSGYFRQLFARNPAWLDLKENAQILQQYAADHPGAPITESVKGTMANIKTTLRRQPTKPLRQAKTFTGYQTPGAIPGQSAPQPCQLLRIPAGAVIVPPMPGEGLVLKLPPGCEIVCITDTGVAAATV